MFWTNWVKGLGKAYIALSILFFVIVGFALAYNEYALIGIIVIVVGTAISLSSVSLIMMVAEMSENIAKLQKNGVSITSSGDQGTSFSFSSTSSSSDDSWVCNCGTRNSSSSTYCRICGKKPNAKASSNKSSNMWTCPRCGKEYPKSQQMCLGCRYNNTLGI